MSMRRLSSFATHWLMVGSSRRMLHPDNLVQKFTRPSAGTTTVQTRYDLTPEWLDRKIRRVGDALDQVTAHATGRLTHHWIETDALLARHDRRRRVSFFPLIAEQDFRFYS